MPRLSKFAVCTEEIDYIKADKVPVCLPVSGSCRVINLNNHAGISSQPLILQLDNGCDPHFI